MAVKDVKKYYYTVLNQNLEMKACIAEYEQAVKDGHFTEEQLEDFKTLVDAIQQNYNRLTAVMYLLEMPNRSSKKAKYDKANKKLLDGLKSRNATADDVIIENRSALTAMRKELEKLTKEENKDQ